MAPCGFVSGCSIWRSDCSIISVRVPSKWMMRAAAPWSVRTSSPAARDWESSTLVHPVSSEGDGAAALAVRHSTVSWITCKTARMEGGRCWGCTAAEAPGANRPFASAAASSATDPIHRRVLWLPNSVLPLLVPWVGGPTATGKPVSRVPSAIQPAAVDHPGRMPLSAELHMPIIARLAARFSPNGQLGCGSVQSAGRCPPGRGAPSRTTRTLSRRSTGCADRRGAGTIAARVVAPRTAAVVGRGVARPPPGRLAGPLPIAPPSTGEGVGDGKTVSGGGAVGNGRIVTGAAEGDAVTDGAAVGTAGVMARTVGSATVGSAVTVGGAVGGAKVASGVGVARAVAEGSAVTGGVAVRRAVGDGGAVGDGDAVARRVGVRRAVGDGGAVGTGELVAMAVVVGTTVTLGVVVPAAGCAVVLAACAHALCWRAESGPNDASSTAAP